MKIFLSLWAAAAGFTGAFSLGLWVPDWITGRPKRPTPFTRREKFQIAVTLPDFFDLLALSINSGQNLEQAFLSTSTHIFSPVLRRLIDPLTIKLRLGLSPTAMLESLQAQVEETPASATVGLLIQALRHGSPVESALREQAEALRRRHQLELEKKAQTIGLKLLIPIGLFLLPALLLLFFGAFALLMRQDGGLLSW